MSVVFKIGSDLVDVVREDLLKPHPFAAERVGFLSCRPGRLNANGLILLAHGYHSVADCDYVNDPTVGAMMGSAAIRKAMQVALSSDAGMFHVHVHGHSGRPSPSRTDLHETARFVPDFWNVRPRMPHGAVILSEDSLSGRCWRPGVKQPVVITEFCVVGPRLSWIKDR
jgi:hypothetical protein